MRPRPTRPMTPKAQYELGVRYLIGSGVQQDDRKALDWFYKAAQRGYAPAENQMGLRCLSGRGVEPSDSAAVEWFHRAALQEYAPAQNNLRGTDKRAHREKQDTSQDTSNVVSSCHCWRIIVTLQGCSEFSQDTEWLGQACRNAVEATLQQAAVPPVSYNVLLETQQFLFHYPQKKPNQQTPPHTEVELSFNYQKENSPH